MRAFEKHQTHKKTYTRIYKYTESFGKDVNAPIRNHNTDFYITKMLLDKKCWMNDFGRII